MTTVEGVAIIGLKAEMEPEDEGNPKDALVREAKRLGVLDAEPLIEVDNVTE